jgi:hypothetical protein
MTEEQLDREVKKVIADYVAELITNREIVERFALIQRSLPPLHVGELDLNTGLRY